MAKLLAPFLFVLISLCSYPGPRPASADETALPLLPGLENSVEFWKLVFTRYGTSEVIFHDPLEPLKIYKVVEIEETKRANKLIKDDIEKISLEQGFKAADQRVRAQRGVKDRFISGLALSRRYIEQMQRIFQEEGLPPELAYLPLVESSFNPQARSRAGALGIWQFMPSTGRKFLRVSSAVDERRDPLESTRAAARFLKHNYELLGTWPLAVTAYNHGPDGILRAVAEVGSNDLMEIIRHYQSPSFGFASKNFYAEFLAALELAQKSAELFPELQYHPPLLLEEMAVERSISIASLLKPTGLSHNEFLEWNPALSPKVRDIPSGYRVKVPPEKLEILLAAYQKALEPSANKPSQMKQLSPPPQSVIAWILHRVAQGETLSQIAKSYRVSVRDIQKLNGLPNSRIAAGQQLKIRKS